MKLSALALLLALAFGCDRGPTPEGNTARPSESSEASESSEEAPSEAESAPAAPERPSMARRPPPVVSAESPALAGIAWSVHDPLTWRRPTRPMRNAEYVVGEGDTAAVMTVFHFPGMGGSIEENVSRWTGQFEGGEPTVNTRTIGGMDVTTVDVSGTFSSSMPMAGNTGPQPNQRLLGAIVAGPSGPVFFKLLGPAETVATASEAFNDLVNSFRAE